MIYDDGINNDFEKAHQSGLTRGFDLGWTYKGEFDRSIIIDHLDRLEKQYNKISDPETKLRILSQKDILRQIYKEMKNHKNNRERTTKGMQ
jgi:hypothetical protein